MSNSDERFTMPTEFIKAPESMKKVDEAKIIEMRQLINGKLEKWANRLQVSMTFRPKVIRQEGERWTDNGKTWEMKGGIPQTISTTQSARMPHWCPRCSKSMSHRFDRKFYYLRGWCYNCNVDVEGQMRVDGTYEKWEKQIMRANEVSFLRDKIQEHLSYIEDFKEPQIFFEDGRWEKLADREVFQPMFDTLMKDVEFMLQRLEAIKLEEETEIMNVENN